MSDFKLDLQTRQMLYTVLFDTFKTRADIDELTHRSLGRPIDYFNASGNDTRSFIRAVVGECEVQGGNTLQLLLSVALELRPYHHELRNVAALLGVKSAGAKSARRPSRPLSAAERDQSKIAARQLLNKYPQIDSFDMQMWQEILTILNLEFSMVSPSGRPSKQRFPKLVEEMMLQNRLEELESVIQKAAKRKLDEEEEQNEVVVRFTRAYDQSDWDKVIALSGRLEQLSAHNQATRNKTAQAYKRRGQRHHDNRDYHSAIECFTQAIYYGTRASQGSCYYSRGRAYFAQGNYGSALNDFQQAIERDASKAVYQYWEGQCYQAQHEYSKAIEVYDRLISTEPQNAEYYYCRGMCYFDLHSIQLAARDTRNTDFAAFDLHNVDLAIRDLRVALYDLRHSDARYALGLIYFYWKDDMHSAKYYFEQAAGLGHETAMKYYLEIRRRLGII